MEGRGCAGGNLSFCERKVSPGPPSKESRFYAVRPAEGGAGGVRTDGVSGIIRAGESGACMRRVGSFCERKVSPGPPSKESRFYAVRPAESGTGGAGTDGGRGLSEQANQEHVRGGGNLSFCERKVSPGPPSKESRLCAVRPAKGGAGSAGTGEETSIRAGESGACTRLCRCRS